MTSASTTGDRILEAGLRAFGTTGIDGTSLDAIARDLGITKQEVLDTYEAYEL